jgi:hypothetical protein
MLRPRLLTGNGLIQRAPRNALGCGRRLCATAASQSSRAAASSAAGPALAAPAGRAAASSAAAGSATSSSLRAVLIDAYTVYDGLLQTQRFVTTTVTGAILALLGDAFTQAATSNVYDVSRGVAFALFGATVTGPVNYVWLGLLNDMVLRLAPHGGMMAVGCKVAIQSLFFQPCVYVPLFFAFTAVFRAWSVEQARERVVAEYPGTLKSLWLFWTPICVFTFAVLPVRQQAIFFSGISLCWNAILSFLANRSEHVMEVGSVQQDGLPAADLPDSGVASEASGGEHLPAAAPGGRLVRTASGRWLPAHQPPMAILDNDPNRAPLRDAFSDQSVLGFLLGPGLM